jgi:PAS domain-containing protein
MHFEEYNSSLDKWFEVFASPMGGNRFAATFSDITERKKAEEERERLLNHVQQEKDRPSALVNSMTDEVWFADDQKKISW